MRNEYLELGQIIAPARVKRAGTTFFPILSMTMRDGLIDQADKFKKRIASADTSAYKIVERNQLVVGFPIDEGVLAFQNIYDEAIVSPAYNVWDVQNPAAISNKYLEGFLRSPRALAFYKSKLRSTTARRRSLPNDIFLSLPVLVPPLAEQERIVKLLDEADELRKLRAHADRRTAALISALFHGMFGDPATNPKGWPIQTAGELMKSCEYGTSKKANEAGLGVPVLRMGNVTTDGQLDLEDLKTVELSDDELEKQELEAGDVLFNRTNSRELVGKTGMWDGRCKAVAASYFIRVRFGSEVEHPQHFTAFMNLPFMKKRLAEIARGAVGQANINSQELKSIKLPLPPLALQKEFAQRVAEIRALETAQATSRTRLDALFQSMLHRAFNGEL